MMSNPIVPISVEEDMSAWLDAVERFLEVNGPSKLSTVGNQCGRPTSAAKMSVVVKSDQRKRFIFHPENGGSLSLASFASYAFVVGVADARTFVDRLTVSEIVAVGIQGDGEQVSLIQCATPKVGVVIFDIFRCPDILTAGGLAVLLTSSTILKVMHGFRNDAMLLYRQFKVKINGVLDLQCGHALLGGKKQGSLNEVLYRYTKYTNRLVDEVNKKGSVNWIERPITQLLLDNAAKNVEYLCQSFYNQRKLLGDAGLINEWIIASQLAGAEVVDKETTESVDGCPVDGPVEVTVTANSVNAVGGGDRSIKPQEMAASGDGLAGSTEGAQLTAGASSGRANGSSPPFDSSAGVKPLTVKAQLLTPAVPAAQPQPRRASSPTSPAPGDNTTVSDKFWENISTLKPENIKTLENYYYLASFYDFWKKTNGASIPGGVDFALEDVLRQWIKLQRVVISPGGAVKFLLPGARPGVAPAGMSPGSAGPRGAGMPGTGGGYGVVPGAPAGSGGLVNNIMNNAKVTSKTVISPTGANPASVNYVNVSNNVRLQQQLQQHQQRSGMSVPVRPVAPGAGLKPGVPVPPAGVGAARPGVPQNVAQHQVYLQQQQQQQQAGAHGYGAVRQILPQQQLQQQQQLRLQQQQVMYGQVGQGQYGGPQRGASPVGGGDVGAVTGAAATPTGAGANSNSAMLRRNAQLEANKHGVEIGVISMDVDSATNAPIVCAVGSTTSVDVKIRNCSPNVTQTLLRVMISDRQLFSCESKFPCPIVLPPGKEISIACSCVPVVSGVFNSLYIFDFGAFTIGRYVVVTASSGDDGSMGTGSSGASVQGSVGLDLGEPESERAGSAGTAVVGDVLGASLGAFEVPKFWQALYSRSSTAPSPTELEVSLATLSCTYDSYIAYFSRLLWTEELHLSHELAGYSLSGVDLTLLRQAASCSSADYNQPYESVDVAEDDLTIVGTSYLVRVSVSDAMSRLVSRHQLCLHVGDIAKLSVAGVAGAGEPREWPAVVRAITPEHVLLALVPRDIAVEELSVKDEDDDGSISTKDSGAGDAVEEPALSLVLHLKRLREVDPNAAVSAFNVSFMLNRSSFKVFHQALSYLDTLPRSFLFPVVDQQGRVPLYVFPVYTAANANDAKLGKGTQRPVVLGAANSPPRSIQLFNSSLNKFQVAAVANVLEGRCRTVPYIVTGPAGSGKTSTVVEIMLQTLRLRSGSKLLVCAATEEAADALVLRLSNVLTSSDLFRLICPGPVQNQHRVHPDVVPFCKITREPVDADEGPPVVEGVARDVRVVDKFAVPDSVDLHSFSVVVGTCVEAGKLFNYAQNEKNRDLNSGPQPRLPPTPTRFDMVIIDDCDQVWEPEALACVSCSLLAPVMPIGTSSTSSAVRKTQMIKYAEGVKCQVVLVGDEQQPMRSRGCSGSGQGCGGTRRVAGSRNLPQGNLNISLLERLLIHSQSSGAKGPSNAAFASGYVAVSPYRRDTKLYPARGGHNPLVMTRLPLHYRHAPRVMAVASELFYSGELQAGLLSASSSSLEDARHAVSAPGLIPGKDSGVVFPVIFHASDASVTLAEDAVVVKGFCDPNDYYNEAEAALVVSYVEKVLGGEAGGVPISAKDIGVVCNTAAQVSCVKNVLAEFFSERAGAEDSTNGDGDANIPSIFVDTVEQFCPDNPFKVIIVCTVLDTASGVHGGLLTCDDPSGQRFVNLVVSCALNLLVCVGNPNFLCIRCSTWHHIVQYCQRSSTYIGAAPTVINPEFLKPAGASAGGGHPSSSVVGASGSGLSLKSASFVPAANKVQYPSAAAYGYPAAAHPAAAYGHGGAAAAKSATAYGYGATAAAAHPAAAYGYGATAAAAHPAAAYGYGATAAAAHPAAAYGYDATATAAAHPAAAYGYGATATAAAHPAAAYGYGATAARKASPPVEPLGPSGLASGSSLHNGYLQTSRSYSAPSLVSSAGYGLSSSPSSGALDMERNSSWNTHSASAAHKTSGGGLGSGEQDMSSLLTSLMQSDSSGGGGGGGGGGNAMSLDFLYGSVLGADGPLSGNGSSAKGVSPPGVPRASSSPSDSASREDSLLRSVFGESSSPGAGASDLFRAPLGAPPGLSPLDDSADGSGTSVDQTSLTSLSSALLQSSPGGGDGDGASSNINWSLFN